MVIRADPPGPSGFDEFYAAHFDRLTMQLWAYTGDLPQAQDVVQEAFCRALARWRDIAAYDEPSAWVRRVAFNLATSRFRQVRSFLRFASRHTETFVQEPGPDRVMLVRALADLPANQRRALVLYHLADLSVADIAAQERVTENTVKSRLRRGRATLAAQLTDPQEGSHHD